MTPHLRTCLGLPFRGFHRLAYWEWGSADAERTVVCVHGLARQGRDFDVLARALVRIGRRVVCPDLAGRGRSGWLADGDGYTLVQYGADTNALLARLDVDEVARVGTSLGGLIGMILAGQPGTPIRRLVINDIGPFVPASAPTSTSRRRASPTSPRPRPISAPSWLPAAPSRRSSGAISPSTASVRTRREAGTVCATIPPSPRPTARGGWAAS